MVVEHTGAAVSDYEPGDQVFGFLLHANPTARDGAWGELITVTEDLSIAPVPDGVELATAGAAALAGITAITAVALDLSKGDVLLVAGATGGVGSLAVQLAAKAGATVVAPALPEDEEYLRGLGVYEVVPRDGDVAAAVRERFPDGVDALLDVVNPAPGTYDAALNDGARIASPTGAAGEGPGRTMVMAAPTRENLERLGASLGDGTLRVPVQATYQLAQAPEALAALRVSTRRASSRSRSADAADHRSQRQARPADRRRGPAARARRAARSQRPRRRGRRRPRRARRRRPPSRLPRPHVDPGRLHRRRPACCSCPRRYPIPTRASPR
jgi:NADPH:quinone reductase